MLTEGLNLLLAWPVRLLPDRAAPAAWPRAVQGQSVYAGLQPLKVLIIITAITTTTKTTARLAMKMIIMFFF